MHAFYLIEQSVVTAFPIPCEQVGRNKQEVRWSGEGGGRGWELCMLERVLD